MAQTAFDVTIGYGIDAHARVSGTVETEPPGLSGLYIKLLAPEGTESGNPLLADVGACPVPVRIERRYNLPPDYPVRIEVTATAGGSGAAVQFTASSTDGAVGEAIGFTGTAIPADLT